ncbi:MAG: amino acid-binding ACT protein [Actinomycetia bacterium]|nr:amino acid-binding ACT protein [Actinomycetes bacterium]
MATLVLTVIGDDQSGLVEALSGVIAAHGGNWDKSHMAHLGGKFAGIVLVEVPDGRQTTLAEALAPLAVKGLLDVTATEAEPGAEVATSRTLTLELVGQDRVGIVHEISAALASHQVSISELQTRTTNAPMGGGMLFQATALLEVPGRLDTTSLVAALEELANELMVDVNLDEPEPSRSTP